MSEPAAAKTLLRREMRSRLAALGAEDIHREALAALDALESWEPFVRARSLVSYLALPAEFDPDPLSRAALAAGKKLLVPRTRAGAISLVPLSEAALLDDGAFLVPGPFPGLREPADCHAALPLEALALPVLVLVPGLAFDVSCRRLGRGKGFYDRFLASLALALPDAASRTSLGLALSCQVLEEVPSDSYDRALDALCVDGSILYPGGC